MTVKECNKLAEQANFNGNYWKEFIDKAKELVKPDLTIAVITTNFSMRGDVSVINKFDKASLCLELGIDLVVELPYIGAVASADYFCSNAINILNAFDVTDIAFGAELDKVSELRKLKEFYYSPNYNKALSEYLSKGFSYSNACNKALMQMTKDLTLIENFSMPNNTLAIQYINTIDKINETKRNKINITVIKRVENNYYDKEATKKIASATAIRELMKDNKDYSPYVIDDGIPFIDLRETYIRLFTVIKSTFILKKDISEISNILGIKEGIEYRLDNVCDISSNYDLSNDDLPF